MCASLPIPWPVCKSRNLTHALTVLSCSRALVLAQMLLDWELGDMTGLEVVEKLREGYPWLQDLRIIMVSGNTPDEQTMATLGALGYASACKLRLGLPTANPRTERVQLVPSLPDDAGSTTTGKSPSLPSSSRTCSASVQRRRQEQLRMPHPLLALPPLLLPLPPTLSLPAERRQCTINCTAPKAISFGSRSEVPCHHARYLFAPAAFRKLLPEGSARQQQRSSTIL